MLQDADQSHTRPQRSGGGGLRRILNKPLLWIVVGCVLVVLCSGAVLAPFLLTSTEPENEALSQLIVGSWEETSSGGEVSSQETETFFPNKTSTILGTKTVGGKKSTFTMTCNWRIRGHTIYYTIIKTDSPALWVGYEYTWDIIKLTDTEMILKQGDVLFTARRKGD
jgi:hypothetical protein